MRRIAKWLAVLLCVSLVLAGCGKKDAGTIVRQLDKSVGKMANYKGTGKMVLHTGQQPLTYHVEVWYKQPHFYRIALTNEAKDITQIVLRNENGVFVLTPHLNKSFRFQSDWPEKQGQVYLYQTLAKSIVDDNERKFATDGGAYVFEVKANYMNSSFARQKIWLNKKNYAPKRVEVSGEDGGVLVEMDFSSFAFGAKFEQDDFDMDRNMTAWSLQYSPAFSPDGENRDDAAKDTAQGFGLYEPDYAPPGVKLQDMKDMKLNGQAAVLLRYAGDYNYTIMEARPQEQTVTAMTGNIVDLGYTIGILMGEDLKTLAWMHDGVEFRMSSGDLPVAEMMKIAQSLENQIGK